MEFIDNLDFMIKKGKTINDVKTALLEVREPFNTNYGFMCRFLNLTYEFNTEEDIFLFLNLLHFKVYDYFRFKSYLEFKSYLNHLPEEKEDCNKVLNKEILEMANV